MLIRGFPVNTGLAADRNGSARFWYWRGASGRKYIHSIYGIDTCPPLPGAVYVACRLIGSERRAVSVGRFLSYWDGSTSGLARAALKNVDADELHVHLLARNDAEAQAVRRDLANALPDLSAEARSLDPVNLSLPCAA